jgi:hypothetical protein
MSIKIVTRSSGEIAPSRVKARDEVLQRSTGISANAARMIW